MIVKSKPLNPFFFKFAGFILNLAMKRKFNKLVIKGIAIKPGHSYILMCNHFSFMDGFLAYYLCNKVIWGDNRMKKLYIMSLKKQMQKNTWLRYVGSFSIEPRKRSMTESFEYAAEILSQPGNLLMFFPQGNLESSHIQKIYFEDGLKEIVPMIKGDCQLIWCSTVVEFFESLKPSLYYNMLDCGTNHDFDFEALKDKVNVFHQSALDKQVRFTK